MGITHIFYENLIINSNANYNLATGISMNIYQRIGLLGACMLQNRLKFYHLTLTTNDLSFSFEGEEINHSFHQIMNTLLDLSSSFDTPYWDLSAAYAVEEKSLVPYDEDILPLAFGNYLDGLTQDELSGIFYSFYNQDDDSTDSIGILCAYGKLSQTEYHGIVNFEFIDSIPTKGRWMSSDSVIGLEIDLDNNRNKDQILFICKSLMSMANAYNSSLDIVGTNLDFQLYQLTIESQSQFQQFISLCEKLAQLTDGEACIGTEFLDLDDRYGHLLILNFCNDCSYRLSEAKIV